MTLSDSEQAKQFTNYYKKHKEKNREFVAKVLSK
jgi:hypothetical protein